MTRASRRTGRGPTPARYEMTFSSRAVPRVLAVPAILLLACHAAVAIYHYRVEEVPWLLFQLFDVDQENNLPTWYSEFLLLTGFAFLWLCTSQKRAQGDRWSGHWVALTVGFLLMSVDEVAGVHETINSVIVMTWAIPAGIMALAIAAAFVPFLLHLPTDTAVRFVLAGGAYLAGAVGIEIVGNSLVGQQLSDTLAYKMTTFAEEGLEMFGVILFLHALLRYMRGSKASAAQASVAVT